MRAPGCVITASTAVCRWSLTICRTTGCCRISGVGSSNSTASYGAGPTRKPFSTSGVATVVVRARRLLVRRIRTGEGEGELLRHARVRPDDKHERRSGQLLPEVVELQRADDIDEVACLILHCHLFCPFHRGLIISP